VNSRLDELQAAFLRVKLRHLDDWNGRRRSLAATYDVALAGIPGVKRSAVVAGAEPVHHLYVIRHPRRDELIQHLAAAEISAQIHYPVPPHRSLAYANGGWNGGALPVAERLAAEVLSLPIGPHVSVAEVAMVGRTIGQFAGAVRRAA
jgi:dTDP-3-amino-3,4,6-trideoxy-alpha-D-glucose transaminase